MRTRTISLCVSVTAAAGLIGIAGGQASADAETCAILESTIQGQLRSLSQQEPAMFVRTAPAILASVQALRMNMEYMGCAPGPLDELLVTPLTPAPTPSPSAPVEVDECGRIAQQWAGYMEHEPLLIPVLTVMGANVLAVCDVMNGLTGAAR